MQALTREMQRRIWAGLAALRAFLPLLVALALIALPATTGLPPTPSAELVSAQWVGGPFDGQPASLGDLSMLGGAGALRIVFDVSPDLHAAGPLGLRLSGPFSATAVWNGVNIGGKGRPAQGRTEERPGRIDAMLPIPPQLVRAGENVLFLTVSHQAAPRVRAIINGPGGLSVVPYSADARRPLSHYILPLILVGVLVLALATLAQRKGSRWFVLFVAAVLATAAAELSRSFVNYPYPLHVWRTAALAATSGLAGIAIPLIAAEAMGARSNAASIAAIIVGATVFAIVSDAPTDSRAAFLVVVGTAIGLFFAFAGVLQRRNGSTALTVSLVLMLVLALTSSRDFFDRTFYAASLPLIALFVLRGRDEIAAAKPAIDRIAIGPAKRRRLAPLAEIKAVHGAGKYCEFELTSGERVLDERTMSEAEALLPDTFFRAHRSHIVNLRHVSSILVLGAGKYAVEMSDRSRISLSRERVAPLRAIFEPVTHAEQLSAAQRSE